MLHPEIELIRNSLKHWGYTGVNDNIEWFPRHCFGDHRIVFSGWIWTLHNGTSGHGFTNLVLAMIENKYQPFDRPDSWKNSHFYKPPKE